MKKIMGIMLVLALAIGVYAGTRQVVVTMAAGDTATYVTNGTRNVWTAMEVNGLYSSATMAAHTVELDKKLISGGTTNYVPLDTVSQPVSNALVRIDCDGDPMVFPSEVLRIYRPAAATNSTFVGWFLYSEDQ